MTKKVWRTPELKALRAGAAENGPQPNRRDGQQGNPRS